jgi:hypothetical protein
MEFLALGDESVLARKARAESFQISFKPTHIYSS